MLKAGFGSQKAAITAYPQRDGWDVFVAYVTWARFEFGLPDGDYEKPLNTARELASVPSDWQSRAQEFLDELDVGLRRRQPIVATAPVSSDEEVTVGR